MVTEQEQRILGYFIDEAKDHLNTIEQGLLNLQNTLNDSEMLNEIFRAAHSVKGGAAMLGFHSIQQTSHRLEDYFKVLKECPNLQVDQKLESLFLRVFDTLKELVEQLEGSFGMTEDVVDKPMSEVEPVFEALHQHLGLLVKQAEGNIQHLEISTPQEREEAACAAAMPQNSLASAEKTVFQNQVMQQLREMLQLFKQPETPRSRQQLHECCQKLVFLGEQFKLQGWCTLCETTSRAIANLNNTYRTLAPIVIKELKHSLELVLADRGAEIKTSEQLQALSTRY